MNTQTDLITIVSHIIFAILILSVAITFFRLYKGPTLPDRIVALDLIASISVGIIITLSFYRNEDIYLDIAVFVTLIVFIGTVAVSKYLKGELYD